MILKKYAKAFVCSLYSNTENFKIVIGILQGGILKLVLLIIFLYYVLQTSIDPLKENYFRKGLEANDIPLKL